MDAYVISLRERSLGDLLAGGLINSLCSGGVIQGANGKWVEQWFENGPDGGLLRGSGYLGYVDSNQGEKNLYFRGLYIPKS